MDSTLLDDAILVHDLLNCVGAAKMNAELMQRNKELPVTVIKNVERILANLSKIQALLEPEANSAAPVEIVSSRLGSVDQSASSTKTILLIDDSDDFRSPF